MAFRQVFISFLFNFANNITGTRELYYSCHYINKITIFFYNNISNNYEYHSNQHNRNNKGFCFKNK
jgi:hypothetical protein